MILDLAFVSSLSLPPEAFDYEPVRAYSVQYVDPDEVKQFCIEAFGSVMLGCTILDRYILLRNDMTPDAARHVLRHEKGHVNGWHHH